MLMLSDEHHTVMSSNVLGPVKEKAFTDGLDHTVQNQPRSDLVLADCVRFGPNRSGPEVSQYASMLESSGHLANATKPIWI